MNPNHNYTHLESLVYNRHRSIRSHRAVLNDICNGFLHLAEISWCIESLCTNILDATEGIHAEAMLLEAFLQDGICSLHAPATVASWSATFVCN